MSEIKYSYDTVNFHKTFAPQDSYLSKILELASAAYSGTKEDISEVTGIPTGKTSGKVVPHILYAAYMGLILYQLDKGSYTLSLTPLGKIVQENDKYLFEDVTKLICHYNLCDEDQGACIWSFVYDHLPVMLDETMSETAVKKKYSDYFGVNVDLTPLKKTYSDDGLLAVLGLIDFTEGIRLNASFFNDTMQYVYAYALLSSWERSYPEVSELTSEQLSDKLHWGKRFGFDDDETLYALESLEDIGVVKLNKQLVPLSIIKTAEAASVLPHLYDLLS